MIFSDLDSIWVHSVANVKHDPFDDVIDPSDDVIIIIFFHCRCVSFNTFIVKDLFLGRALKAKRFGGFPSAICKNKILKSKLVVNFTNMLTRKVSFVQIFWYLTSISTTYLCRGNKTLMVVLFLSLVMMWHTHIEGRPHNPSMLCNGWVECGHPTEWSQLALVLPG